MDRSRQKPRKLRLGGILFVLLGAFVLVSSCQMQPPRTPDLQPLRQQLQSQNWRGADAETLKLLLRLKGRTEAGWLRQVDVESLDCQTLTDVDQLWSTASGGKFGFNAQRQIWLAVGGIVGQYTPEIAAKAGERLGWRDKGRWRTYTDLNFSLDAPAGHLPALTGNGVSGSVWGGVATISQRLQYCRHQVAIRQARTAYYADCAHHPNQQRCRLKVAADRWGERSAPDWGQEIPILLDRLEGVLAHRQWIEADKITKILLDHYRQANWAEFGDHDSLQVIPCYLLRAVDALWQHYSQGRLGLSAQKSVLAKLRLLGINSSTPGDNQTPKLAQALGWPLRHPSRFEASYNLAFNAVTAKAIPKGYYPYDMGYSYATFGSGYNNSWRLDLNPACGFN